METFRSSFCMEPTSHLTPLDSHRHFCRNWGGVRFSETRERGYSDNKLDADTGEYNNWQYVEELDP